MRQAILSLIEKIFTNEAKSEQIYEFRISQIVLWVDLGYSKTVEEVKLDIRKFDLAT